MSTFTCKIHGCEFDRGADCPKCLDEEIMEWSDNGEPPYDEEAYQRHIASEGNQQWNANPDGCWFCGGDHHSDCCSERY